MEIFDPEYFGDGEEDYGSAEEQEIEGYAFRLIQIIPKRCVELIRKAYDQKVDHPAVFLCDVSDPMGLSIALKFTSQKRVKQIVEETKSLESKIPGIYFWYDVDQLQGREPSLYSAISGRMNGLIGYFPIVVAAKGGYNVFPWPMEWVIENKSSLNLLMG